MGRYLRKQRVLNVRLRIGRSVNECTTIETLLSIPADLFQSPVETVLLSHADANAASDVNNPGERRECRVARLR